MPVYRKWRIGNELKNTTEKLAKETRKTNFTNRLKELSEDIQELQKKLSLSDKINKRATRIPM